jgi:LysM repeat protein
MDKKYQALKANPESPEFKLLELIKEHHLDMQKNASNYGKLYLDVPRYSTKQGDFYQAFQKGEYGQKFKNINSNVKEWLKQKFGKSTEDYLNDLNYDADNNLVNTDLNGDEISYIPVTGIFNIDADLVDADIFNSLFRYALSVQTQKQLYNSLPLVKSIISTLEDPKNQPKNLQKKSKQLQNAKTKVRGFANLKTDVYNRLEQVRSLIEREYYGRKVVGMEEANPRLTKWLSNLTKWSSRSSLLMNIPSDLKNQFSGYVQTIIESTGGRFVNNRDLALSAAWASKAMIDWTTNGIYTTGPGNLSTQLVQIFDPNFKTTDQYGNTVYRSMFKDLMNFEWTYMHRKFGEMDVAMRLFGAFLHGQKLEQTLPNGEKATIRYVDAWEQDENGVARLKAGIHPGWSNIAVYHTYQSGETFEDIAKKYGITVEELKAKNRIKSEVQLVDGQELVIAKSENYKLFKNRLQGTSRALFGVYDDFGQPEGNKLLLYRMFFFMRKWFTPMFTNRFGMDTSKENFGGARYDWALGKTTKGFYVNALQVLYRGLKSKGVEFQFMTDEEKADLRRAMAEGMIVAVSALLASLLFGYEDGDEDKWKKIKERSGAINSDNFNTYGFLTNHALLLLLGVQAETGAFIPLPKITIDGKSVDLGADDYSKLLTSTSTAFSNTILTYMEIFGDVLNFVTGSDGGKYKRDTGPYWFQKEGESKIYKRVFNLLGFSGGSGDPETLLKNLSKSGGRIR